MQVLEEDLAQLLRGTDVEGAAGQPVDLLLQLADLARDGIAEGREASGVQHHADVLHLREDRHQRQLDIVHQRRHVVPLQQRGEVTPQGVRQLRPAGQVPERVGGRLAQRQLASGLLGLRGGVQRRGGDGLQREVARRGLQQIGGDGRVEPRRRGLQAEII